MSRTIYAYKISKLQTSSTMMFITYAQCSGFVRRNLMMGEEKTLSTILPSERIISQQSQEKNFAAYFFAHFDIETSNKEPYTQFVEL